MFNKRVYRCGCQDVLAVLSAAPWPHVQRRPSLWAVGVWLSKLAHEGAAAPAGPAGHSPGI